MANIMAFKQGDVLIGQGDEDAVAYLIQSGWVEVRRKKADGQTLTMKLQAGEVVGELGLAGLAPQRTATITALTDCEVEVIDRGALIRLVNGPANRLTPLLSALFSRLKSTLNEDNSEIDKDENCIYAKLTGLNPSAQQALCNQTQNISHLPWRFGAYHPPQTVTDLFAVTQPVDVKLAGCSRLLRPEHIIIEASPEGGLQLRLAQRGDYCLLNEKRIGYGQLDMVVPLEAGEHTISFGDQGSPFEFQLNVLQNVN